MLLLLLLFDCQRQQSMLKMHSLNCRRIFHLMFMLQVLLIFSHFIPAVHCTSATSASAIDARSSDAQVTREHRTINHKLELKNFTGIINIRSDDNNNNIKPNYINLDLKGKLHGKTIRKIVASSHLSATFEQQTTVSTSFVLPLLVVTQTSSSDIATIKSFLPSKTSPQTVIAHLFGKSPYTDTRIQGLNIDGSIICDCSINVTPISNDKRQQEASARCLLQCSSGKHRNRKNAAQFPDTMYRLSPTNTTNMNDKANQRHEWHTTQMATQGPLAALSFKQLSIVEISFFFCFHVQWCVDKKKRNRTPVGI